MRSRLTFLSVPWLPASAAAHGGPHDGMSGFMLLAHLLGQHLTTALLVAFVGALLVAGYAGTRRRPGDRVRVRKGRRG